MESSFLFLIGRLLFGGFFLVSAFMHFTKTPALAQYAASKKLPLPRFMVLVSGAMMAIGGVGILAWAFVPFAVWCLVIFLLTAAFKFHDFWTVADPMQKQMQMLLFMRNFALSGGALLLLAIP